MPTARRSAIKNYWGATAAAAGLGFAAKACNIVSYEKEAGSVTDLQMYRYFRDLHDRVTSFDN